METRNTQYIALDIDETIVDGHIHNTIAGKKTELEREIQQIKKDIDEKAEYATMDLARSKITDMNKPVLEKIMQWESSSDPGKDLAIQLLQEDLFPTSDEFIKSEVAKAQELLPSYKKKLTDAEQYLADITNNPKAQYELIKHLKPLGNKEDWQHMWKEARKNGFEIAGLSYGSYAQATAIWLSQKLEFECQVVAHNPDQQQINLDPDKMTLISYLPIHEDQRRHGKNKHIEQFLRAKGENDAPNITQRLTLIDDSQNNVSHASRVKFNTILVKRKSTGHIKQLCDHIDKHNAQKQAQYAALNTATDALPSISKNNIFGATERPSKSSKTQTIHPPKSSPNK